MNKNDTLNLAASEIMKSNLFDYKFYAKESGLLSSSHEDLILHYLRNGAYLGLNPNESFSTNGYLDSYHDVKISGINPFLHYIKRGKIEGRSPSGAEKESLLIGDTRRLPRFGSSEYGKIDHQIIYDSPTRNFDSSAPSLCVHLHLFHQDMLDEFAGYLNNIPIIFDLLVSICQPNELDIQESFERKVRRINKCVVRKFENRGRDVAPWIVGFAKEIQSYDLFFHFHSKKSDYKASYSGWRDFLLHNTVGSPGIIGSIIGKLIDDKNIGLIHPPYFSALPNQPKWGANKQTANTLLVNMNLDAISGDCPDFPSGSFFWARTKALYPLFSLGLKWEDFEQERGQLDGTLGHAIERILCIVGKRAGFFSLCSNVDVSFNLVNYWDKKRLGLLSTQSNILPRAELIPRKPSLMEKRIAVYTCITGNFDNFLGWPVTDEGVDYFLFSDKEIPSSEKYISKLCPYYDPEPRRMARFIKTHPHFFFDQYDYVVWMDANIVSSEGVQEIIEKTIANDWDVGFIPHPIRTSYIDEAKECMRINADNVDLIQSQLLEYAKLEFPRNNLMETNIVVSAIKRKKTCDFFNAWWREICRFSLRDQISVEYALFTSAVKYGLIFDKGYSVRNKKGFQLFAHGVDFNAMLLL